MKKQYNILYYHGLDSFLSEEKKDILERFGTVTAPTYNYRNPEVLQSINNSFDDSPANTVLIGSSFGGFIANLFSLSYDLPCLLFNPALAYRSIDLAQEVPFDSNINSLSYIVLGSEDKVINCADNLVFINQHFHGPTEIIIEEGMEHRVPVDIFEKHVTDFFSLLNNERTFSG